MLVCVCYACKPDSSCSCILGLELGSIDLNPLQSLRPLPSAYFLRAGGLACPMFRDRQHQPRSHPRLARTCCYTIRGMVAVQCHTEHCRAGRRLLCWDIMSVQTWGSRSERLEKWGSTERILLVVFRGRRFGTAPGRTASSESPVLVSLKLGMAWVFTMVHRYIPPSFVETIWGYAHNILGPQVTTQYTILPSESLRLGFNRTAKELCTLDLKGQLTLPNLSS